MSIIAIYSDIHANLEAYREVVRDMDAHPHDAEVCLGDVVGYGPQPQECCDLLRQRGATVVQGNHERGMLNIYQMAPFNQPAKDSLRRTRQMIDDATFDWLISHPRSAVVDGCRFVHGVPPDDVNGYLWKYENNVGELFARFGERICFVGHTHDLMRFVENREGVSGRLPLPEGETLLNPEERHIVNVGAVGQPRDGDNRAKYALYDTERHSVTMRFITYDIKKTADLIRAKGFHRAFADRLW
ncbi:metallophosphoesterase family protein [Pseudodesulfovibrio sp.]|uniref:metallophosphoesterase family protein n=1 Tax=unclassified Pseudodesulfovibrio TaxID=2661612 RepID=UPI003AFF8A6E